MHISRLIGFVAFAWLVTLCPQAVCAHLVNGDIGEFYAGMLHPVTSIEHLLPIVGLALLAGQCGKRAGRRTVLIFPLALVVGIVAGSRFPLPDLLHFANLVTLSMIGILLMTANRWAASVPAAVAMITGLILGWRSGGDWAVSQVGFQFVPGAALTGFIIVAVIAAWIPRPEKRAWGILRTLSGGGFLLAGLTMLGYLATGGEIAVGRGIGMPTEESLKALVSAPQLSPALMVGAILAATAWGAAHALTPGHGKAIVGAYLVGVRGTPWHALCLGLTVTVTHTLGVFILGLTASLADSHVEPEKLYPWLGILSGLIVFALGAVMFSKRLGVFEQRDVGHPRRYDPQPRDHNHTHFHHHEHGGADNNDFHPEHPHYHHHHHEELHADAIHSHGHPHHRHDSHGHSHLPPGADGSPVTWRSLLTLGISGGLLPCPAAMVLLLSAVALQRIWFGLALVTAFSTGLALVLTVVGLLFIKGSRLIDRSHAFAAAGRWLPTASALMVCLLGGAITWSAASRMMGG